MQEKYEVINDDLSVYPDISRYEQAHGVTHYDFQIFSSHGRWGVKARPYKNWKERMQADMKAKGL